MRDPCPKCGKDRALVGRAHNCTPAAPERTVAADATAAAPRQCPVKPPNTRHAPLALQKHGGDRKSETVKDQDRNPTLIGRGRDYDIAPLERDRPDLAARVRANELSANAAAIEAGFRKKPTKGAQTAV